MTLQQLVNSIQHLSGTEADLSTLLAKLKAQESSLRQSQAALINCLRALDPVQHSLGYLYLLDATGSEGLPVHASEEFIGLAVGFLQTCSTVQIRMAPDKFVSVSRKLKEHLLVLHQPRRAVLPLRTALYKLAPSSDYVTPIHAEFLQVCTLAKCYNSAVPILQADISDVDPAKTAMTPRDLMLYCYYGGLIHIGRKSYAQALDLLLQGLTAPTMVVNAITLAAYKKYALVSLIHQGNLPPLPKYMPTTLQRSLKTECQAYQEFAAGYGVKSNDELQAFVTAKQAQFAEDGNGGLVRLALEAKTKRSIQRLTQTYLTLSLADIAQAANLRDAGQAELYVLRMIDAGDVHAQIDASQGMVRFLEDPEEYNSAAVVARLATTIDKSIHLAQKLQAVNNMVSCDKAYLNKLHVKERHSRYEDTSDMSDPMAEGRLSLA
ncbi:hypothetical protein WJX72_000853 [[Myrmecia] bisecta]|uniref:COP9 signalosome complex subunit 3 n=1 Tax=[Myrmecia] bisecta TaxID=41462 RepID=A0AAW1PPF4_9CHLO